MKNVILPVVLIVCVVWVKLYIRDIKREFLRKAKLTALDKKKKTTKKTPHDSVCNRDKHYVGGDSYKKYCNRKKKALYFPEHFVNLLYHFMPCIIFAITSLYIWQGLAALRGPKSIFN